MTGGSADILVNNGMQVALLSPIMPDCIHEHVDGVGHMVYHFLPDKISDLTERLVAEVGRAQPRNHRILIPKDKAMPNILKRIFSRNTDSERDRVPDNGESPRVSDTLVGTTGAPDADLHPEAAADASADTEAGAMPDDGGGIEPLKKRD